MKNHIVAVATLLGLAGSGVRAQDKYPSVRATDAGTFSIGLTSGSARISCTGCPTSKASTGGLQLFGGAAVDSVNVTGVEINYDRHSEDGETDTFWQVFASDRYYLGTTSGFFLKAGLGFGHNDLKATDGSGDQITSSGLAYSLGAGLDKRIRQWQSITFTADLSGTNNAGANVNGIQSGERLDGLVLRIGVAFTAHAVH